MLEEALSNNSQSGAASISPAETALALLSFLRQELPLGGTAAEARFLRLYPLLLQRIFGPLEPPPSSLPLSYPHSQSIEHYHEWGGWLSRVNRWSINATTSSNSNHHGSSRQTTSTPRYHQQQFHNTAPLTQAQHLQKDPVYQLLSGTRNNIEHRFTATANSNLSRNNNINSNNNEVQNLIDAIDHETNYRPHVRFTLPFTALPKRTQLAFMSLLDPSLTSSLTSSAIMEHHPSPLPFTSPANRNTGDPHSESNGNNAARLLGHILSISPQDQKELRFLLQQSYSLQHSSSVTPNSGGIRSPMMQRHMNNETSSSPMSLSSPIVSPRNSIYSAAAGNSPVGLSSATGALRPVGSANVGGENNVQMIASKVNVLLTMLENYIIMFIRYPLAAPGLRPVSTEQQQQHGVGGSNGSARSNVGGGGQYPSNGASGGNSHNNPTYPNNQRGTSVVSRTMPYYQRNRQISKAIPYGEAMYQNLFKSYLRRYFPHDFQYGASNVFNIRNGNGIERNSELFLRTVIEFWLEGNNVFTTTSNALQRLSMFRRNNSTYDGSNQELQLGLDASYDMAQIIPNRMNTTNQHHPPHPLYFLQDNVGYTPPPQQIQHCLKVLVNHFIGDPAIASWCCDKGDTFTSRVDGAGTMAWPLPAAHTILQPSLYNYIRSALAHAPVHVDDSVFFTALNAWLVWLEPWNVSQRKRTVGTALSPTKATKFLHTVSDRVAETVSGSTGGTSRKMETYSVIIIPKPNSASKYTSAWQSYVAANLHFYTVPLAIFLRRAREFDFSSREYQRSLTYVQRVFRIFSPQLVDAIQGMLGRTLSVPVVLQHERTLGDFCPLGVERGEITSINLNSVAMSLTSCKQDMLTLIDEIYLQYRKTLGEQDFFDKIFGFGNRTSETMLDQLVARARVMVKIPQDYQGNSADKGGRRMGSLSIAANVSRSYSGSDYFAPERIDGGILSDKGREQIVRGTRMCNAMDVKFLGDPMFARVRSYENALLVHWTLYLSNLMNRKFGLFSLEHEENHKAEDGDDDTTLMLKLLKEGEESSKVRIRINLRFLADYRNIFCLVILHFFWKCFP